MEFEFLVSAVKENQQEFNNGLYPVFSESSINTPQTFGGAREVTHATACAFRYFANFPRR